MTKAKASAKANKTKERISPAHVDKFAERRAELAEVALKTLSELGYARTSLREIAQNTPFSLGVIHYYFTDKVDLIMHCVRQYKARCVTRYDEIVAGAKTSEALRTGFAAGMAQTLREDGPMHRLWYDLRSQSLFEKSFRKDVAEIDESLERMIGRIVSEFAALAGAEIRLSSSLNYALFDGVFQQALLKHLSGDRNASAELEANVQRILGEVVAPKADAVAIKRRRA